MGRKSRGKWERRNEREAERRAFQARAAEQRALAERGAAEGRRRGCLICRRGDGGFTAREHIVPESLGNTERILPVGVVCDRCNHEVCAPLDQQLCSWLPLETMRTLCSVPNKSGKIPTVKFDNGQLERRGPLDIHLNLSSHRWMRDKPANPGQRAFDFTAKRRDMGPGRLSSIHRALVKQALEFIWLDYGHERALSDEFDPERRIVLEGGHHAYLAIPRRVVFDESGNVQTSIHYGSAQRSSDGRSFLFIIAEFLSVPLATDTLSSKHQPGLFQMTSRF